jgi:hypothetical protein
MLPPPPSIADEDREELWDLIFFGSDSHPLAQQHPHYRAWLAEALRQLNLDVIPPQRARRPTR